MNTAKKSLCILLMIAFLAALFPSCSGKTDEVSYALTKHALELPAGHTALDIAETVEGYLLLSGFKGVYSVVTPLDNTFRIAGESTDTPVRAVSFAPGDGTCYYYANSKGAGQEASYDLYQDDKLFMRLGIADYFNPVCSMEVMDGILFAALPPSFGTWGNNLIIGANKIDMPSSGEVGESYSSVGFMRLGQTISFVSAVQVSAYRDQSETLIKSVRSFSRLFQINGQSEDLPHESTEIEYPVVLCASNGTYGYFLSDTSLYRTDGESVIELCDTLQDGISDGRQFRRMIATKDGKILLLTGEGLLEYAPAKKGLQKETIRLAACRAVNPEKVKEALSKFNQNNEKYAISLKIYDGPVNLNLALLSGKVDMIMTADQSLLGNFIKQDLLFDLEELCPALYEEGKLIESIVDAARVNGVSYYLPRVFLVQFCSMDKDMAGDVTGFDSFSEFVTFVEEKDPAFFKKQIKSEWFERAMESAYEWLGNGAEKCSFEEESFLDFLRSCDFCSEDWEEANANSALQEHTICKSIGEGFPEWVFSDNKDYLGEDRCQQVIFPLPSTIYNGYGAGTPFYLAAVKGNAKQEAQKAFLEFFFTDTLMVKDLTGYYGTFTIREEEYDAIRRNDYMETFMPDINEDDMAWNYLPFWYEETDEKTNSIIENVDHFIMGFSGDIQDIMLEEAGRYFTGQITAEKAAEYIQNRVTIYLEEHK